MAFFYQSNVLERRARLEAQYLQCNNLGMAVETGRSDKTTSRNAEQAFPNAEFIERCQIEYERNPGSRVFAPLAEAYRRMGLIDEAFEVASRGVRLHPDFAAGRIAYARIMMAKGAHVDAVDQLQKAAELSPDNILAFQLLGETHLELRRPKEALRAFKVVLFLNPLHDRAQKMVRKWEFLTADEFEDADFDWTPTEDQPLDELDSDTAKRIRANPVDPTRADREAYRAISIADALTVRNDIEGAFAQIARSLRLLGPRPDLEQRLMLLGKRMGLRPEEIQRLAADTAKSAKTENPQARSPQTEAGSTSGEIKKARLKKLLHKVSGKVSEPR